MRTAAINTVRMLEKIMDLNPKNWPSAEEVLRFDYIRQRKTLSKQPIEGLAGKLAEVSFKACCAILTHLFMPMSACCLEPAVHMVSVVTSILVHYVLSSRHCSASNCMLAGQRCVLHGIPGVFSHNIEAARKKHLQLVGICYPAQSLSLHHLQGQLALWFKRVPSGAATLEHGQAAQLLNQAKAVLSPAQATHMAVVKHGSAAGMPAAATKPIPTGSILLAKACLLLSKHPLSCVSAAC